MLLGRIYTNTVQHIGRTWQNLLRCQALPGCRNDEAWDWEAVSGRTRALPHRICFVQWVQAVHAWSTKVKWQHMFLHHEDVTDIDRHVSALVWFCTCCCSRLVLSDRAQVCANIKHVFRLLLCCRGNPGHSRSECLRSFAAEDEPWDQGAGGEGGEKGERRACPRVRILYHHDSMQRLLFPGPSDRQNQQHHANDQGSEVWCCPEVQRVESQSLPSPLRCFGRPGWDQWDWCHLEEDEWKTSGKRDFENQPP